MSVTITNDIQPNIGNVVSVTLADATQDMVTVSMYDRNANASPKEYDKVWLRSKNNLGMQNHLMLVERAKVREYAEALLELVGPNPATTFTNTNDIGDIPF